MNRNFLIICLVFLLGILAPWALAQETDPDTDPAGQGHGLCQFIDEDGDGFNDLAPDADGDGIPNGLDPDYVKPEDGDGDGDQFRWGMLGEFFGFGFGSELDAGRQGVDNMYGPGDGTGGMGPADGTGFGPGTGVNPGDGDGQDGQNGPLGSDGDNGRRGGRG